ASFRCRSGSRDTHVGRLGIAVSLAEAAYSDGPPLEDLLEFPTTRRDPECGYTLRGRRFDDPYAWLERLDDPETQEWIAAQEAVTRGLLSAVPGRDWLGLATRCWSSPCPLRTARWSRSARP